MVCRTPYSLHAINQMKRRRSLNLWKATCLHVPKTLFCFGKDILRPIVSIGFSSGRVLQLYVQVIHILSSGIGNYF